MRAPLLLASKAADMLADPSASRAAARLQRLENARSGLLEAATALTCDPADEDAWRDLCRARATLRALVRCSS